MDDTEKTFFKLVSETFGVGISFITLEMRFLEDLGADEIGVVELFYDACEKFNIQKPLWSDMISLESDSSREGIEMETVGDMLLYIKARRETGIPDI